MNAMHVLFCNWRDTAHPEGGGSEYYVEQMARGLVEAGHQVTIAAAAYPGAARDEFLPVDGGQIRFVRSGDRFGVYPSIFARLLTRRYGTVDVVVDVHNGLPFFARWATRKPVVVLLHHVHREQWPVVFPGLIGKIGWWVESKLAPRVYRRSTYITVSAATRLELIDMGIDRERITIIHNGTTDAPESTLAIARSETPRIAVLSRLVPHKQIEHAIDAMAVLRERHHDLHLDIIGSGWWDTRLREHVAQLGLTDAVTFHGFVDHETKHRLLAEAWVMALPSLKEGWGQVIGEAGLHRTPTVAYASAGGTTESIDDKDTGLLVDTPAELTAALDAVVSDPALRDFLGEGARAKAESWTWEASRRLFVEKISSTGPAAPLA